MLEVGLEEMVDSWGKKKKRHEEKCQAERSCLKLERLCATKCLLDIVLEHNLVSNS